MRAADLELKLCGNTEAKRRRKEGKKEEENKSQQPPEPERVALPVA